MGLNDIEILNKKGIISSLDIHFAKFICNINKIDKPEVFLAAALVSKFTQEGHICIDISEICGEKIEDSPFVYPDKDIWIRSLEESHVIGKPGEYKPLILDNRSRLYLFRYWEYQQILSDIILKRISNNNINVDCSLLNKGINRFFHGSASNKEIDWQNVAAIVPILKNFSVISGGPGTGKSTIVSKIMALLIDQAVRETLRFALVTPTGKAASRLQESLVRSKEELDIPDEIKNKIPHKTSTIHRLLRTVSDTPYFYYNADNKLPVDVVIVDEASMIDLALMSKLFQAVPLSARIILLGDMNQLASVEAGAVFGDICNTGNKNYFSKYFCKKIENMTGIKFNYFDKRPDKTGVHDIIINLKKNYRFNEKSGIGEVTKAINSGDGLKVVEILKSTDYPHVYWKNLSDMKGSDSSFKSEIIKGYSEYLQAKTPLESIETFGKFRVLCALRKGFYGAVDINIKIENILKKAGLIKSDTLWYKGRPVMIKGNDYDLKLYNGDIGIAMPDMESNNEIRVFFIGENRSLRKIHPVQLGDHETVFAMTVHKSQGSEFENIILVFPDHESPVVTRELIYTGISRASKNVQVWAKENIFIVGIEKKIERSSGLKDILWEM